MKKATKGKPKSKRRIAALIDPDAERKWIDACRADLSYAWPLLPSDSAKELDPRMVRSWARPRLFRPMFPESTQLSHMEARALSLARYFQECAVFVHDEQVPPQTRHDADAAIERAWRAIARIAIPVERRLRFLEAIDAAEGMKQRGARVGLRRDYRTLLSVHVGHEDSATARALGDADETSVRALVAAWSDRRPGRRRDGDRKWKLAAKLWNSLIGDDVRPKTLQQLWSKRARERRARASYADELTPTFVTAKS
ncbi:MAG TPA: hypothetical protein VGH28_01645 [Polyangiaceae bacterium]